MDFNDVMARYGRNPRYVAKVVSRIAAFFCYRVVSRAVALLSNDKLFTTSLSV